MLSICRWSKSHLDLQIDFRGCCTSIILQTQSTQVDVNKFEFRRRLHFTISIAVGSLAAQRVNRLAFMRSQLILCLLRRTQNGSNVCKRLRCAVSCTIYTIYAHPSGSSDAV